MTASNLAKRFANANTIAIRKEKLMEHGETTAAEILGNSNLHRPLADAALFPKGLGESSRRAAGFPLRDAVKRLLKFQHRWDRELMPG